VWEGLFEPLKILIIFNLLFKFNMVEWKSSLKKNIMKALTSGDIRYIKYIFTNNILNNKKEYIFYYQNMFFFYFIS
jgi:hypothetical protein